MRRQAEELERENAQLVEAVAASAAHATQAQALEAHVTGALPSMLHSHYLGVSSLTPSRLAALEGDLRRSQALVNKLTHEAETANQAAQAARSELQRKCFRLVMLV